MKFGVVLQTDPPARRVIELAKLSEQLGFDYVWTFDSPVLWQEPFVIYSGILAETSSVMVGPMVTNPLSRSWAVTASMFATLNDMYGNRTVCGIGRGDSAVRVTGGKPASLATLDKAMGVIKDLAEGRPAQLGHATVTIPWVHDGQLEVLMAAYGPGPRTGRPTRRRAHPPARRPVHHPVGGRRGPERRRGRRPRPGRVESVRGCPRLRGRRPA